MGHGVNRGKGNMAINYVCELEKADLYTVRITGLLHIKDRQSLSLCPHMKTEDVRVLSLVENEFQARFTHPRSISLGCMGKMQLLVHPTANLTQGTKA